MGQAELVEAAAEARAKAAEAHEGLTQARTACQERVEVLAGLQAQLAADRDALAAAMEELGRATGEAAQRLGNAVNEAALSVGMVDDTAEALGDLGVRVLEAVSRDLEESAAILGKLGTTITDVIAEVEEVHRATFQKAGVDAVEQLQRESDRAESHLAYQQRSRLERLTPAMHDLLDDAIGLLETTLPLELDKAAALWSFRAEHTLDRVTEAFAAMQQHADEVAAHCAYQLGAQLGAARETVTTEAGRVATELQALTSSLAQRRADLAGALQALAAGFDSNRDQLDGVAQQLEQVRFRWSTFGFVSA